MNKQARGTRVYVPNPTEKCPSHPRSNALGSEILASINKLYGTNGVHAMADPHEQYLAAIPIDTELQRGFLPDVPPHKRKLNHPSVKGPGKAAYRA